ncbi:hypothetical protein, partial [Anaerotruncus colihominis]|uniref:hypothetical protein n=1 Tax=Anaerotruncus colihominis TaxID=169435 RepID=UPI0026EA5C8F
MKNQKSRLFLQTGADAALKSLEIQKDSCVFFLAFSGCLRIIRQFLFFQTSPRRKKRMEPMFHALFYILRRQ